MTMEQFKASGRKQLGKEVAAELARAMYTDYQQNFSDEIRSIGWGKMPLSVNDLFDQPRRRRLS